MSEPTLIQSKTSLPVDQIEATGRLRPVSEAGIATLRASIAEIGQITNPITVRQLRRGGEIIYRIIDGAHRHATAVALGWGEIPVRVYECTDDQARIMEIDGNLAGAELNPLDNAVFLATRKVVYERLHPETKADAFKGNRHTGSLATEPGSAASFAAVTAEKFGLTERQVRKIVSAGSRLGPDEIAKLRAAPRQVTLKDLQDISRIGAAPERYDVVRLLAAGEAKNAAHALKALRTAFEMPVKDPVEEQFAALVKVWGRAGMAARRRFVSEFFEELGQLGADEEEARFEAEKLVLLAEARAMRGAAS